MPAAEPLKPSKSFPIPSEWNPNSINFDSNLFSHKYYNKAIAVFTRNSISQILISQNQLRKP